MNKPLWYWLATVVAYEIAYYFNLKDITEMLYPRFDEFFRHFGL